MTPHPDYCYKTNINIDNAFKPDWVLPGAGNVNGVWTFNAQQIFQSEWLDYMKNIGYPVEFVHVFYRPAGFQHASAHVDITDKQVEVAALNWIIGGRDSVMKWYRGDQKDYELRYTENGIPFVYILFDRITEQHSTNINGVVR
jgi:hypothetical protein